MQSESQLTAGGRVRVGSCLARFGHALLSVALSVSFDTVSDKKLKNHGTIKAARCLNRYKGGAVVA